jgi:hypothetical protein
VHFDADRPFHYFIRDNATSSILFLGRMSDPRQSTNSLTPAAARNTLAATARPLDSNGDGQITPIDALVILNHLNRSGAESEIASHSSLLDNNQDGIVTHMDFLRVINWINADRGAGEAESAAESRLVPDRTDWQFSFDLVFALEDDPSDPEDLGTGLQGESGGRG